MTFSQISLLLYATLFFLPLINIYKTDRTHWFWKTHHPLVSILLALILVPLYSLSRLAFILASFMALSLLTREFQIPGVYASLIILSGDSAFWMVTKKLKLFSSEPLIYRLVLLYFFEFFLIIPLSSLIASVILYASFTLS